MIPFVSTCRGSMELLIASLKGLPSGIDPTARDGTYRQNLVAFGWQPKAIFICVLETGPYRREAGKGGRGTHANRGKSGEDRGTDREAWSRRRHHPGADAGT